MRWIRRAAEERFDFAVITSDVVERVLQMTGVKPHLARDARHS